ncbi:MAG: ABC transporter permease [Pseudomonadota bacterium]
MSGPFDKRPVPLPPPDRDPLGYSRGRREASVPLQTEPPTIAPTLQDPTTTTTPRAQPPRSYTSDQLESPADLYAAPVSGREKGPRDAPIVPAGSVAGGSLTLVIAIMCFFASLTAGAVYLMNQSAAAWLRNVASEVTVQVEPRRGTDVEATLLRVKLFLDSQPGITNTSILSLEESRKLLEPWLGSASGLEDLPIPRLISVQIDRSTTAELTTVIANLNREFANEKVALDDHRQWRQQIRTVTGSFALGGFAILLLVGAATTAIIISATRSAMLSNREIVEVLHFIGATDRFIAREFERHFLTIGIRAGLVGAVCAALVFFLMPVAMQSLGGGTVTAAELRRLLGTGTLDGPGYLLIGIVVVVISALCMLTSRFGVYRILNAQS